MRRKQKDWIMDCGQGVGTESTVSLHVNLTSQAPDFITYYSLDLVHQWSMDSPLIETTGTMRDLSVGSAYGLQFTFSYDETGRYTMQHSATIRVPDGYDEAAWPNGLALPTSPRSIVIEEDSCYEVDGDNDDDNNNNTNSPTVSPLTAAPTTAAPLTISPTPVVRSVPLVNDPATIPTSSSACPVSARMGGGFLWPTMGVTVATAFLLLSGQNRF